MASETETHKSKTSHSVGVNVTTKTETTPIGEGLELNPLYFKTVPGILKIVQLLFGIICMICGSPVLIDYVRFFMFVVAVAFIFTIIFAFLHFFTIRKLLPNAPWLQIELIGTGIATVLYFIASIVMLIMSTKPLYEWALRAAGYYAGYIAGGVFALFNFFAYAMGTLLLFKDYKGTRGPSASAPNGSAS